MQDTLNMGNKSEIQDLSEFQIDQVAGGCPFVAFGVGIGVGIALGAAAVFVARL